MIILDYFKACSFDILFIISPLPILFFSGGDRSPNSGKVRCPCRPSWEGMIDARPYVSDYY